MKRNILFFILIMSVVFINVVFAEEKDYYDIKKGDVFSKEDDYFMTLDWRTCGGENYIGFLNENDELIYWMNVPEIKFLERNLKGKYLDETRETKFRLGETCESIVLNNVTPFDVPNDLTDSSGRLTYDGAKRICREDYTSAILYETDEDITQYNYWEAVTSWDDAETVVEFCENNSEYCENGEGLGGCARWTPTVIFKPYIPASFSIECDKENLKKGENSTCVLKFESNVGISKVVLDFKDLPFEISDVFGIDSWNVNYKDGELKALSPVPIDGKKDVFKFNVTFKNDAIEGISSVVARNIVYETGNGIEIKNDSDVKDEIEYIKNEDIVEDKIEEKEEKNPNTVDLVFIVGSILFISLVCFACGGRGIKKLYSR